MRGAGNYNVLDYYSCMTPLNPSYGNITDLCGNLVLDEGLEECEDGNIVNGDGCDSTCLVETGWE